MEEVIRVCIVDDHIVVRQGVQAFLATQPDIEVVGEAGSGEEAIQLVRELAPDVLLLDLAMPGLDGVETTRRVKQVSPQTHVVVLTSYVQDEYIFPAIRAGALSYLLKESGGEEIVNAIHKAARGEAILHPRIASRVVQELQEKRQTEINPFSELSEREMEVLHLIANGFNNAAIAERLVISEGTVKSHVNNILSKLHLTDRTQAAIFAWREGIVRK
ncbi:DNA-binding response regulator [Ktedonobacter sp. SOSP1-85]|uniref:response regulator n=1 Tax=Ktedonobacter sp. SOSP1-85 TaxID=2778367 RepID=UPI001915F281|nr:response regulator transcription factor [Ktedonobacter sp. SOSP1-85]GHO77611.1 DNA-binding response regulator [Ktedonobacter sp. SOSP1-85]